MKNLIVTISCGLVLAGSVALSPTLAIAKHHRTPMERYETRVKHREAKEQHWAREADEKAQAVEEKHAEQQGRWEHMMDEIGRPQAQGQPMD
jgi:hypothetical protein